MSDPSMRYSTVGAIVKDLLSQQLLDHRLIEPQGAHERSPEKRVRESLSSSDRTWMPPIIKRQQRDCSFLDLPDEIKVMIFNLVLVVHGPVTIWSERTLQGRRIRSTWKVINCWMPPPLTAVSSTIRNVAWEVYFNLNREFILLNDDLMAAKLFLTKLEPATYSLMTKFVRRITITFNCHMGNLELQNLEASCMNDILTIDTIIKRKPEVFDLQPLVMFPDKPTVPMPADMKKHFSTLFQKKLRGLPCLSARGSVIPLTRWVPVWLHGANPNYQPLRNAVTEERLRRRLEEIEQIGWEL